MDIRGSAVNLEKFHYLNDRNDAIDIGGVL